MRYYKALVKYGHQGTGKSYDTYRYIYAKNMLDAVNIACRLGGVKHHQGFRAVPVIREIPFLEYCQHSAIGTPLRKKINNYGDAYLSQQLLNRSQKRKETSYV